jgi:hypothetical protein
VSAKLSEASSGEHVGVGELHGATITESDRVTGGDTHVRRLTATTADDSDGCRWR